MSRLETVLWTGGVIVSCATLITAVAAVSLAAAVGVSWAISAGFFVWAATRA